MADPSIISVAITGSLPRKKDNPAVPITIEEQVESTHEAFEAGATLVHLHVRNDDETPTSAPERFAQVLDGIRKHCPGMITQVSTGSLAVPPSRLCELSAQYGKLVVAVAGGGDKREAILGAMRGRFANVLVTDEDTAEALLAVRE